MTMEEITLIEKQQEVIHLYKEMMQSMKDREIKAAEYLTSVSAAIKNEDTRQMGLDHLDRYIASMKERNSVKA
jgi:hypothetical protein